MIITIRSQLLWIKLIIFEFQKNQVDSIKPQRNGNHSHRLKCHSHRVKKITEISDSVKH